MSVSNEGFEALQGQPQWRRNVMIVGFPFALGIGSFSIEGALDPISGAGNVSRLVGLSQEESSC